MARQRYWIEITEPDSLAHSEKPFRVRYNIPGLGFGCETVVSEETSRLLKVAIEAGKELGKQEIRLALGVDNL